MYLLNKKFDDTNLKYNTKILNTEDSNFIILDDNIYKNINDIKQIVKEIEKFKYNVKIINIQELMANILVFLEKEDYLNDIDTVLCVGTGGKQAYEALLKKSQNQLSKLKCYNVKWSRNWENGISNKFVTNIEKFDLENKNIMIIEDVIATGETLYNLYKKIKDKGGNTKLIISGIINEGSPLLKKSFVNTVIALKINGKEGKDPFWYPAIYSTRHLFYGDLEMPDFYEILNKKYFNGSIEIEKSIKERRKNKEWKI